VGTERVRDGEVEMGERGERQLLLPSSNPLREPLFSDTRSSQLLHFE